MRLCRRDEHEERSAGAKATVEPLLGDFWTDFHVICEDHQWGIFGARL